MKKRLIALIIFLGACATFPTPNGAEAPQSNTYGVETWSTFLLPTTVAPRDQTELGDNQIQELSAPGLPLRGVVLSQQTVYGRWHNCPSGQLRLNYMERSEQHQTTLGIVGACRVTRANQPTDDPNIEALRKLQSKDDEYAGDSELFLCDRQPLVLVVGTKNTTLTFHKTGRDFVDVDITNPDGPLSYRMNGCSTSE